MRNEIIFKDVPDKRVWKETTSLIFKDQLIEFFGNKYLDKKCYEFGTARGHTTRVLSYLFGKVTTIDLKEININFAQNLNKDRDNIEYILGNAYADHKWWNAPPIEKFDVFFIDCVHSYKCVVHDIETSLRVGTDDAILIFDDYGLASDIRKAVSEYIDKGILEKIQFIGEEKGSDCRSGRELEAPEGVMCRRIK